VSGVYVEPVRQDFWQLARKKDGHYVDPLGPKNCMTHSAARSVMRATEGIKPAAALVWPPTGYEIRMACKNPDGTTDLTAGVNHTQVAAAVKRLYGVTLTLYYGDPFDDIIDLLEATHGVQLSIWYKRIRDDPTRRGSFTFYENHELFISGVDRARGVFTNVVEPLADGRQDGLYHGPGEYKISLLKAAAGELNVASSGYRALGFGRAYYAATKATGTPPSSVIVPHVVTSGPATSERNVMLSANGRGVTTSRVIKLAAKQPIFRHPGGPRITATSDSGSFPVVGSVDGWTAIKIRTRGGWADGIVRDTIAYVPSSAGPEVSR